MKKTTEELLMEFIAKHASHWIGAEEDFSKDLDTIIESTKPVEISEGELQQDFRDWLGWNDQETPGEDDPDYYTYSWGMNVWCNAYKAYKHQLNPK